MFFIITHSLKLLYCSGCGYFLRVKIYNVLLMKAFPGQGWAKNVDDSCPCCRVERKPSLSRTEFVFL